MRYIFIVCILCAKILSAPESDFDWFVLYPNWYRELKINCDKMPEIRVVLDRDFDEKIRKLKDYYGIKNTTELIRFLITEKFRQIIT
jgi:hypothetical protein